MNRWTVTLNDTTITVDASDAQRGERGELLLGNGTDPVFIAAAGVWQHAQQTPAKVTAVDSDLLEQLRAAMAEADVLTGDATPDQLIEVAARAIKYRDGT